ncbi:hypothetical protein [Lysobacter sp. P5_B9]|jgi:hypothetical protein
MKTRRVFSTPDLVTARAAIQAAKDVGIHDEDISLVARSDIEGGHIPNRRQEADSDFVPAAMRGALFGGLAGLLAGAIAVIAFPSVGMSWAGAGLVALAGVLVGAFASALVGSSLPDPVRQKFDGEIKAGRILVLVDGAAEILPAVETAVTRAGALSLPFETPTALIR